jgi:hypothetical protein
VFDDPNLVSSAGLVPVMRLAERAGLGQLADQHLTVPTDKGANAGLKVASLVAGMVAGADSIDDMAMLRHGGMAKLFSRIYAPSTLGSFLRAFTFGHIRQLDAIASRFLLDLVGLTGLLGAASITRTAEEQGGYALVDVDDTVVEVHGYAKQGAGFGYNRIRGLNALLATVSTTTSAPVIVAQRLRKRRVCVAARRETAGGRCGQGRPSGPRPGRRGVGADGFRVLRSQRGARGSSRWRGGLGNGPDGQADQGHDRHNR